MFGCLWDLVSLPIIMAFQIWRCWNYSAHAGCFSAICGGAPPKEREVDVILIGAGVMSATVPWLDDVQFASKTNGMKGMEPTEGHFFWDFGVWKHAISFKDIQCPGSWWKTPVLNCLKQCSSLWCMQNHGKKNQGTWHPEESVRVSGPAELSKSKCVEVGLMLKECNARLASVCSCDRFLLLRTKWCSCQHV